jgi:exopolysaccharide/PEP-CTERM locus tyrosine autokinase
MTSDKMAINETQKGRKGSIAERVARRISSDVYTDLASGSTLPSEGEALASVDSLAAAPHPTAARNGEVMAAASLPNLGLTDGAVGSTPGPDVARRRKKRNGHSDEASNTLALGSAGKKTVKIDLDHSQLTARGYLTPNAPLKRMTEEYRLIKRALLNFHRSGVRSRSNLILITSAMPGEGKTFTAINLALSLTAEDDISVLLVDADANKAGAAAELGCEETNGLKDVLERPDKSIDDVILQTDIPNLAFVPSGRFHARSTELLAGARMNQLADELASRHPNRIVLFDCPPMLATTEASALTSHVGQVLFVVRAEVTKESTVRDALDQIDPSPEVGLVLNRSHLRLGSSGFSDYYSYYQP